jgi:hypothetical protein
MLVAPVPPPPPHPLSCARRRPSTPSSTPQADPQKNPRGAGVPPRGCSCRSSWPATPRPTAPPSAATAAGRGGPSRRPLGRTSSRTPLQFLDTSAPPLTAPSSPSSPPQVHPPPIHPPPPALFLHGAGRKAKTQASKATPKTPKQDPPPARKTPKLRAEKQRARTSDAADATSGGGGDSTAPESDKPRRTTRGADSDDDGEAFLVKKELEVRVIALSADVARLKNILEEKDEKIAEIEEAARAEQRGLIGRLTDVENLLALCERERVRLLGEIDSARSEARGARLAEKAARKDASDLRKILDGTQIP